MIKRKEIVLYGEISGEIKSYPTLWDAYRGFKEIKEYDKKNGIEDTYCFMFEVETENESTQQEIKIYKRGNKIFYKFI